MTTSAPVRSPAPQVDAETARFLEDGKDFVDEARIETLLESKKGAGAAEIRDILAKSLALQRLEPAETAALLGAKDPALWEEIFAAAGETKMRVYGPRVVIFAPLYCSNHCVNSCAYCGFRQENETQRRRRLSLDEVRRETEALVSKGHKRLILVYGEHPDSGAGYIADTIQAIYGVKTDRGEIRRVNVNAAPMSVADFRRIKAAKIGTYQVFQETYHHETYARVHPRGPKSDYAWRLYALHRAQDAGIDDVAVGALFGLYDWRFEVMGLLAHAIDLEKRFNGVGPHTISFPRLLPAEGSALSTESSWRVSDEDFLRLVAVLRLSVPYTGLVVTARETPGIRRRALEIGVTQTDASTRIGLGAYSESSGRQQMERQQFMLGDTRELDEVALELSGMGLLTSFCTADYRCGRTGSVFMGIAKKGKIQHLCIPNAILTFREYLLDYASPKTREAGLALIERRMADVPEGMREAVRTRMAEIDAGRRDLFF
ncbi:MAG: [FeFe] hydrogenase H-cluster radical SAM maturase HydG [Planctomycetota bacterium]